jgi:antibiotic biosynthesis monooxygenase (ABM) superfamily enzyme
METRLTLVVSLFIHPGREAEFEQFESAAAAIMQRYAGKIERRIACASQAGQDRPHELHIVTFPDQQSFDRFRSDADLAALADLRARAIRETTVWPGVDLPPFGE